MSNRHLDNEIITVGDLIEYLQTNFDKKEFVVKSDMMNSGYTRFRRTEVTRFHIVVNPDSRDDREFIDPVIGKTYSEGQGIQAVVL